MRLVCLEGTSAPSIIACGEALPRLGHYIDRDRAVIVTDGIVRCLYGDRFPAAEIIEIGTGEASKTLATVSDVYDAFLRLGVDRSSCVVAVGGGIVCDVAGFAASTYLRGLRFGFVPTTLLAQVDASVGGKNGVNLDGYKNLVGTFSQPAFVLCDHALLATLSDEERRNGFAEVIKQAALGDADLFSFLEAEWRSALRLDGGAIERVVYDSLRIKTAIVSSDERESGERMKLNLGHTIGHALEKVHGMSHGRAVSLGMVCAARLSHRMGLIGGSDVARVEALISAFGLPVSWDVETGAVLSALLKDKKRQGGLIRFVLLEGIGRARVTAVEPDSLTGVIDDLRKPR